MIMLTTFIFAFLCIVALTAVVHAQNQSGFISIDCGIPENENYADKVTGINYVSDAPYVDTAVSHSISPEYSKETVERQFSYLRSFPEGIRNCYTLRPPNGDVKFLIRARFMYGNYDGLDKAPSFDLMLGADAWDSVQLQDPRSIITKEIIHMPNKDYIHVCLVNTDSGIPFISALELRPLTNSIYPPTASDLYRPTPTGSMSLVLRWDVGSTTKLTRYPADIYDRIWWPDNFKNVERISTSSNVNPATSLFQPPVTVMQSAIIPANGSSSFWFSWESVSTVFKYYTCMYFSEFESEQAETRSREMNIYLNGRFWSEIPPPQYLNTTTHRLTATNAQQYVISIMQTKNSSLAPILNALEIYQEKEFLQLLTNQQDDLAIIVTLFLASLYACNTSVDAIMKIKSKYEVKRDWQGDPCAPKVYMWQGINCSYDANQSPRIISMDLSKNSLTGPVPEFLAELQSLRVLNLSGNNLQGSLPSGLSEKVKNGSLSLSLNILSSPIDSSVDGNRNLCPSASCKKKSNKFIFPVLASVVSFCILLALLAILQNLRRRKQAGKKKGSLELENRKFSYFDVLKITNNFERVLGKGGFGTVYHGYLDDKQVAVKMLSSSSVQGYKQFQAEVELLIRAHHKNLTILVGYCDEGANMGLIYEFMANGNLQAHLLEDKADTLCWERRLQIASESAQGLEYLHNGCKPPIVHRDVKSANILLNEKFQAKLADFGLSRIFPVEGGTHVSTTVVGTPGYLDPEYYISNRLTEKSDVYSFGVVLLELITGQPVIQKTPERTLIGQWVSSMLARGDIKNIVDQRLQGDFDTNTVWKAVEIAMACIHSISTRRPTMNQVVIELNDCLAMEIARTKAHETAPDGTPDELMIDLNLHSDVFPLAR
ncbi:protein kinase domain-containing protein [Citrus sinensis]|uniref:Protein kinase domain-containing protein n=1 Tax=Citrus sinensis TaxID=2711 RepID=A0ACB8J8U2_CITSI|nr:protein kinase domain-containing protein [Citrus sinensis]